MPERWSPVLDAESEIVRVLAEAGTIADAAEGVLAALAVRLGWDVALLWVPDDDSGLLRCGPGWSADDPGLAEFRRVNWRLTFAPGVGLPGRVWATAEPLWVPALGEDDGFPRAALAERAGIHGGVAIPVLGATGVLGVVELLSRAVRYPRDDEEEALRTAGTQLAHYVARVRAEERLLESEERTAAIFEAALDCVITMDHKGAMLDCNAAAEATFGFSRDDAIGRPLAELIVPPERRDSHRAGLRRYLETREPRILNRRLELEAVRADGTRLPVELTVARLGRREPPVFAGFVRDITPRQEAEAERSRLVKDAVAARAREEAARVRAESAQTQAEIERSRVEFLAEAGLRMAAAMDYVATIEAVARAAVPRIAHVCAVTGVEPNGRPQPIAIVHADPERERLAREHAARHPGRPAAWPGVGDALRTGRPQLLREVTGDVLAEAAAGDEQQLRLLRALGLRSALTVPVRASGRTLGAITLGFTSGRRSFSPEDEVVATALAARAGLHIENARLYTERSQIAHTLQQSLLPAGLPTIPGVEVAAHYRAAGDQNEVGGDFYDVFPSEDGVWTAVIGDVSGKGAPAAALTSLARHTLYAAALRDGAPARNLAFLNEVMRRRSGAGAAFCTVIYARVCPADESTALTLASGGHPHPLILRAGGAVERVEAPGTLVGVLPEATFEERGVRLAPGDLMLMYTDGAVELRRHDLAFGDRELERLLRELAGLPAEEVVSAAARRIDDLQDGSPRDDVALLALRMAPGA